MKPIRCILFDLDGTLYDSKEYSEYFDSEITQIVANLLHLERNDASRLLQARRKELVTLTRAVESMGIDRQEFHRVVAARLEPARYLSHNEEARNAIRQLRTDGAKIGLVSNSGRGMVVKILGALGLEPALFDVIVTGTDVEPKPSHQPFEYALDKLRCDRAETVYIGDRDEAEIRPAHEIGLRTILISQQGSRSKWADRVITRIGELPREIGIENEYTI
jgi:HAD superfamily hydrolase (TIGR01549 family)